MRSFLKFLNWREEKITDYWRQVDGLINFKHEFYLKCKIKQRSKNQKRFTDPFTKVFLF